MSIPNFHVLRVKYIGPTNHRESRVKITSDRFKQSLTVPFDHALNNVEDMAAAALLPLGFKIIGLSDGYIISDTFEPLRPYCHTCRKECATLSKNHLCPTCAAAWVKS